MGGGRAWEEEPEGGKNWEAWNTLEKLSLFRVLAPCDTTELKQYKLPQGPVLREAVFREEVRERETETTRPVHFQVPSDQRSTNSGDIQGPVNREATRPLSVAQGT